MVLERKELGKESQTGATRGRFQGSKRGHVTPEEETGSRAQKEVIQEARRAANAKALRWGCLPARGTPAGQCAGSRALRAGEGTGGRRADAAPAPAWEPCCPHCCRPLASVRAPCRFSVLFPPVLLLQGPPVSECSQGWDPRRLCPRPPLLPRWFFLFQHLDLPCDSSTKLPPGATYCRGAIANMASCQHLRLGV